MKYVFHIYFLKLITSMIINFITLPTLIEKSMKNRINEKIIDQLEILNYHIKTYSNLLLYHLMEFILNI